MGHTEIDTSCNFLLDTVSFLNTHKYSHNKHLTSHALFTLKHRSQLLAPALLAFQDLLRAVIRLIYRTDVMHFLLLAISRTKIPCSLCMSVTVTGLLSGQRHSGAPAVKIVSALLHFLCKFFGAEMPNVPLHIAAKVAVHSPSTFSY